METFADYLDEVAPETKPKGTTSGDFQTQLKLAKDAYRQKYGKDLPITSQTRTREKQQELFNRWKAGDKSIYMPTDPAKYPNKQIFHENAADISSEVPESFLNQFGIHRPLGKKDPVHAVLMPSASKSTTAVAPASATAPASAAPSEGSGTFGDFIDEFSKGEVAKPSKVSEAAKRNLATTTPLSVPTAENLRAEEERKQQVQAGQEKQRSERGFVEKYVAPILEVPLAVTTAIPGAILGELTGGKVGGYIPKSGTSREIVEDIGKAFETSKIEGLAGMPILSRGAKFDNLKKVAPSVSRAEPILQKPRITYEEFKAQQAQKSGENVPLQEASGTTKPVSAQSPFSEIKYSEIGVPVDEQFHRAQTLRRVMGDDYKADLSAIKGHGKDRATKYAVSNTDTEMGNFLKDKFVDEQNRLSKYINQKIKDTGGTVGLDESTVYKRGNTILQPFKDLENYFDNATEKIYSERNVIAKNVPVIANNVLSKLDDRTLVEISDPAERLAKTAKVKMQQLGMMDGKGNLLPTDAYHSELFRKWLNQNWSREASQLHKALKTAVDEDVLANLDKNSSLYKEARALVELRKNTLDNPKGISNILDSEGPKGINRKVQIEKIAQNIADMPVDQFTHVIDTLKNVPKELQPQAQKAIAEIKAQFVNRIAEQKTPKQLTDYMNNNREVMTRLFPEKEINALRDYHNSKHILATDTGYKGAAVQTINVEKKLGTKIGEQLMQKGGAAAAEFATGGSGMGVPAIVTHEIIGGRIAKRQAKKQAKAEAEALRAEEQKFVPITNLLPPKK
jgi:hypothetical protein